MSEWRSEGVNRDSLWSRLVLSVQFVSRFPIEVARVVLEAMVARRGLVLLFVGVAMLMALSGWLRPPLSPDLRAQHIPLSVLTRTIPEADQILSVPRNARWDSIGGILLGFLTVGGMITLVWPRGLFVLAAILLWLSLVANMVLCLNYP